MEDCNDQYDQEQDHISLCIPLKTLTTIGHDRNLIKDIQALIIDSTKPVSSGNVICRNCCHPLAPSMLAASFNSCGSFGLKNKV